MRTRLTLVNVRATLLILRIDNEPGVTGANVTTIRQIDAVMLTSTLRQCRTAGRPVTTQLVRTIPAIVRIVAYLCPIDTFPISALVLCVQIARLLPCSTQRHIVLVRTIPTVVDTITDLVAGNAPMVGTLEPAQRVTVEVRTDGGCLVRVVTTIVRTVAQVRRQHAQIVRTLEP